VPFPAILAVFAIGVGVLVAWRIGAFRNVRIGPMAAGSPAPTATSPTPSPSSSSPTPSPTPSRIPTPGPINTSFPGLTTFRGNASRDYYGEGPVPAHPRIIWRYPTSGALCSQSSDQAGVRTWCGTGWTGQPNVIQHGDGTIEVRIGAYDDHYHFLNGVTGQPLRPDLVTGDLAKGSATSDPDGYPLYYAGSRDNLFRVVALDRKAPTVLWSMDANTTVPNPVWNNDWDGAALVIGDYLLEGGENSWFYVVKLNRGYNDRGKVVVAPKIVATIPGWDQELLDALGDTDISIENSVAFRDGVVYFANSGGLVQGWDISGLLRGGRHYRRVFRFWDGDETDASIVIDGSGFLYVGRHRTMNVPSRSIARDEEIGDLMKLDPSRPRNPLVWSVQLGGFEPDGGLLGTPALYHGVVYATYTEGGVAAVDARTGKILWKQPLAGPTWSSPVPIDGKLIVGDGAGYLNCFDISNRRRPPKLVWRLELGGTIESTPAVWRGWIFVGTRAGAIFGVADPRTANHATG
jgi:outer membrane protein assembly factor BamB